MTRKSKECRKGKGFKESRGEMEQKVTSGMREEDWGSKKKMKGR